ncbi:MAG: hypothetical protein WBW16_11170 [Bacteroidota bacterium]
MKSYQAELENKNEMTTDIKPDRGMIRHAVATMVYRGAKTLRDAPTDFGAFCVKPESRTPVEIVAHMGDLFDWALSMAKGQEIWHSSLPQAWDREVARFYASVKEFDTYLANSPTVACPLERLFQGPIADAISHVGQLAMLRHLFGAPIRGENYFKADISIGQVGPNQAPPRKEFD